MTLTELLMRDAIRLTATPLGRQQLDGHEMDKWRCLLTRRNGDGRHQMTLDYWMGVDLQTAPEVREVLVCLVGEANDVVDGASFEEWASGFGYDTDSRKAEQVYRAVVAQTERLKQFLGEDRLHEYIRSLNS